VPDFLKICPVETDLFYSDGRTDGRTKLIDAVRNLVDTPINTDLAKVEIFDHINFPLKTNIKLNCT
jgi:hypothetical protein